MKNVISFICGIFSLVNLISAQNVQKTACEFNDYHSDDFYGSAVATNGKIAAIGSYNFYNGQGAVYIYQKIKKDWKFLNRIMPDDAQTNDAFGYTIAIGKDLLAIGATGCSGYLGAVYIYKRINDDWVFSTKLQSSVSVKQFGYSLSMDGDFLIVGNAGSNSGVEVVSIFKWNNQTWDETLIYSGANGEGFGQSVSISGDYAVIGATTAKFVNIYQRVGNKWNFNKTISKSTFNLGIPNNFQFGFPISISGNYLAVASSGGYKYTDCDCPKVFIFRRDASDWILFDTIVPKINNIGYELLKSWPYVTLNNDNLIIGHLESDNMFNNNNPQNHLHKSGLVYHYKLVNNKFILFRKYIPNFKFDYNQSSRFGNSISMSGNSIIIGDPGDNSSDKAYSNLGSAYYIDFQDTTKSIPLSPEISINKQKINFNSLLLTKIDSAAITLSNKGNDTLFIKEIFIDKNNDSVFSLSRNDYNGVLLLPNESVVFSVLFNAKSLGDKYSQLIIKTNDPKNLIINIPVSAKVYNSYNIGEIPPQIVFLGQILEFKVSNNKNYPNYDFFIDNQPKGVISFNKSTQFFNYKPDNSDKHPFTLTFFAYLGNDSVTQKVTIYPKQLLPPEQTIVSLKSKKKLPDPNSIDYIIKNEIPTKQKESLNGQFDFLRKIDVIGKNLIFERGNENKLFDSYCRSEDSIRNISEFNIYGDTVIIKSPIVLHGTHVKIYSNCLLFDDEGNKEGASITTTPFPLDIADGNLELGIKGNKGGNIEIFANTINFETTSLNELITNGGTGQISILTGLPGNGGDAGNIEISTSNYNSKYLGSFVKQLPGVAGMRGVDENSAYCGMEGNVGNFILNNKQYSWIQPSWLRSVLSYGKDIYLKGYLNIADSVFIQYSQYIVNYQNSKDWNLLPDSIKLEFTHINSEFMSLSNRISNHIDYFGNPAGWVPLLSYEANKLIYENEIDEAFKVLYLTYWIGNRYNSLANKVDAIKQTREQMNKQMTEDIANFNVFEQKIVTLSDEIDEVILNLERLKSELESLMQSLIAKAKQNVEDSKKKPFWEQACGVLAIGLQSFPIGQPGLGILGKGLESLNNFELSKTGEIAQNIMKLRDEYKDNLKPSVKDWKDKINAFDPKSNIKRTDRIKSIIDDGKMIYDGVKKINDYLKPAEISADEIEKEFNRIKAQDPVFISLTNQISEMNVKKTKLESDLNIVNQAISKLSNEIDNDLLTLNILSIDIAQDDAALDTRIQIYITDMQKRAQERLLKYHYYFAKSYEYRMLKPYDQDLNLMKILESWKNLIVTDKKGYELNASDYQSLESLFTEQLSSITEATVTDFNTASNGIYHTSYTQIYSLTKNQIENLNSVDSLTINIFDEHLLLDQQNREDIRINNISIAKLIAHTIGSSQHNSESMDLLVSHSGISKLIKGGEIYTFNYSGVTVPLRWGATYTPFNKSITPITLSFADSSLIRSLLKSKYSDPDVKMQLFSQPSLWTDLKITKKTDTTEVKIIIDSLTFQVDYSCTDKNQISNNLDISVSNTDLSPLFIINQADNNIRQDGKGKFYRSFTSGSNFTIEAEKQYGIWSFSNWSDINGKPIDKNIISDPFNPYQLVKLKNNIVLKANYNGPLTKFKISGNNKIFQQDSTELTAIATIFGKDTNITSQTKWTVVASSPNGSYFISNKFYSGNTKDTTISVTAEYGYGNVMMDTMQILISSNPNNIKDSLNNFKDNLVIYPNPVQDFLEIKDINNFQNVQNVEIISITGDKLFELNLKENINVSKLNSGIYFMKLGKMYCKFIKL